MIGELQLLDTVDFEMIFTDFFAYDTPEHFALVVLFEGKRNLLIQRLLLIRPADNRVLLFTEVVLQFEVASH